MYSFLGDAMTAIAALLKQKQSADVRVLASLQDRAHARGPCLDLFVYQISKDRHTRTLPVGSEPATQPLVLHFLLIPGGAGDGSEHLRTLGRGMQVLVDHPVISGELMGGLTTADQVEPSGTDADGISEIRISPHDAPVGDIQRMWSSADEPYTVSAAYQAVVSR